METASALPTGTLTFLFTDIEGSTRLLTALEREGYRELLETHNHQAGSFVQTDHLGSDAQTRSDRGA
jgi:class 3 adenylate cyclase